jgi:hypothetical protein
VSRARRETGAGPQGHGQPGAAGALEMDGGRGASGQGHGMHCGEIGSGRSGVWGEWIVGTRNRVGAFLAKSARGDFGSGTGEKITVEPGRGRGGGMLHQGDVDALVRIL